MGSGPGFGPDTDVVVGKGEGERRRLYASASAAAWRRALRARYSGLCGWKRKHGQVSGLVSSRGIV